MIIGLAIVVISIVSLAIDYYLYSWTSFIRPFGCESKRITATEPKDLLNQDYDLAKIWEGLETNSNYRLESWHDERRLFISRTFGNIKYHIHFENYISGGSAKRRVTFLTKNADGKLGEDPTTPNYQIFRRVYLMIDEMPLNPYQKDELKRNIRIACSSTMRFG